MTRAGVLAIVLLATASVSVRAQGDGPGGMKQARAVGIYDGHPPVIDGVLEPVWDRAPFVTDVAGVKAGSARTRNRTEVGFLFDHEALYVSARLWSDDPEAIRALLGRRDEGGRSEAFVLSLDTYLDRRTAYSFEVTAAGTRIDYYHPQDRRSPRDLSFDPVWSAATAIDSLGWTLEMRIPFSQVRFHDRKPIVWGLNWMRRIPARNRTFYWIPVPAVETGWASRFGDLVGIAGVRSGDRVELVPYVAGEGTLAPSVGEEWDLRARAGADLKAGLGSGTLEVTVNPDFGQIEADPAEINLTAYETFFPERRPFFIEGSQLLRGGGPRYFYSRRIGAPPSAAVEDELTNAPQSTTILGAAKLTGQWDPGVSVATLMAVTSRERARMLDPSAASVEIEPFTGFGVARVERQFGSSGSTAGLILTGVRRQFASESGLERLLSRQAYAGGGDWNLRFLQGRYEVGGHIGFSRVEGDSLRIFDVQRSSAHYFQRPDADHVHLDPSATSLAGYTGAIRIAKQGGRHWLWSAGASAISPGFEINDTGILRSADEIDGFANLRYRETRPGSVFQSYQLALSAGAGWNFGGMRQYATPALFASATWRNLWRSYLEVGLQTRAESDDLTRGGPRMGTPEGWRATLGVSGDKTSTSVWNAEWSYARDESGGGEFAVSGEISLQPSPHWGISVVPGYARAVDSRQYFTTLDGGRQETFGQRYVFSRVDHRTLYAQLRANLRFTPDLGIDLYAEPFASSGRFHRFGELPAPGGRDLRLYGTEGTSISRQPDGSRIVTDGSDQFILENADFNVRSFRSNAVFRWEWRRGSTIFLIWQRDQLLSTAIGEAVTPADFLSIVPDSAHGEDATTTLGLKLTVWIPVE